MSKEPWDTYITTEHLSDDRLEQLNNDYFPKIIMSAGIGEFAKSSENDATSRSNLISTVGTSLSTKEISAFSDFTIETFYKVHTSHYPLKEVEVFKAQQATFFSLPFHFLRHEINNQIIGYLVAGMLKEHPFFKEPVWHIGYWGMGPIKDKNIRSAIKSDWGNLLAQLNKTARVGGNVDYFNKPAATMALSFGMKVNGYRMDPR